MAYRSILVHLGSDARSEVRSRLAMTLAQRFGAHLSGLYVIPPLIMPASFGSPMPMLSPEIVEAQRDMMARTAADAAERFTQLARAEGIGVDAETLEGDPGLRLAERARYADLTVVGQSEQEGIATLVRQLPEQVVLESGRGVLVVPYAGRFDAVGERVVIAWNGGREAVRAAEAAMPLLERATSVTVFEMDPRDGTGGRALACAHALARHGVRAEARHTLTAGVAQGEILLSTVAEAGADLLVMGAYGRSRARELILGGVTRSVLAHMTVPVLMAY